MATIVAPARPRVRLPQTYDVWRWLSGIRDWRGFPSRGDPRIPFAAILTIYVVIGTLWLGFNRSPTQIALTVLAGCALDMVLHWMLRNRERLFPLSAFITSLSIAILLNYAHDHVLLFFPIFLAIGSKYLFTLDGRHHFNPSLFGVAATLLLAGNLISAAPAYQWGGSWTMSVVIIAAALFFVFRIGRGWLIVSFLLFYALQTALRAWLMRAHLPPEMLFIGTMTSPPFFLFTFFMLTDPKTSPSSRRAQVAVAFAIATVDLWLHTKGSVFTFFYAAFAVAWGRFLWGHGRRVWSGFRRRSGFIIPMRTLRAAGVLGLILVAGGWTYRGVIHPRVAIRNAGFMLSEIPSSQSGLSISMDSGAYSHVDPRLRHVAKWILSVGASVAAGDVDGDGRVDLVLTAPLGVAGDRASLWLNRGDFRFERVEVAALKKLERAPAEVGLPAGALLIDYDGDGDRDLFIVVSFGVPLLLRNELRETGALSFTDVTSSSGITLYVISVAANALDYDRDGDVDILIGNALDPQLPGYNDSTRLNIFRLPQPAFRGDRRMFRFMHDGWHDARNGGRNVMLRNRGDGMFETLDAATLGMPEKHWTLGVGTGDMNGDGWTDLYLASDFGRDDFYINESGRFRRVSGRLFSDIGMDTYKGMNSSIADVDRDGRLDVYVSNVHHPLQAEGSLLWMNRSVSRDGTPRLRDEAASRGALNENRFGWGAAIGDLSNDGWPEIVQANGMVDDRLDDRYEGCPDYWYANHKVMQSTSEIHTYADMWGDIRGRCIYPNEPRRVYLNRGAGKRPQFVDVAAGVGLTGRDNSRGVALADLDNDGQLDVIISNQHGSPSLFRNRATLPAAGAWLGIRLVGDGRTCTRDALGSRVQVMIDGQPPLVREVQAANGFSSQHDMRIHFGLGSVSDADLEVQIRWCGGEERAYRLAPGRYHEVWQ